MLRVVGALAIVLLTSGCARRTHASKPPPECPTAAKFEALKKGMTREEVNGFLGMPGVMRGGNDDSSIVDYACLRRKIRVSFVNGRLMTKDAEGL